jgi:hypothetical protein
MVESAAELTDLHDDVEIMVVELCTTREFAAPCSREWT